MLSWCVVLCSSLLLLAWCVCWLLLLVAAVAFFLKAPKTEWTGFGGRERETDRKSRRERKASNRLVDATSSARRGIFSALCWPKTGHFRRLYLIGQCLCVSCSGVGGGTRTPRIAVLRWIYTHTYLTLLLLLWCGGVCVGAAPAEGWKQVWVLMHFPRPTDRPTQLWRLHRLLTLTAFTLWLAGRPYTCSCVWPTG